MRTIKLGVSMELCQLEGHRDIASNCKEPSGVQWSLDRFGPRSQLGEQGFRNPLDVFIGFTEGKERNGGELAIIIGCFVVSVAELNTQTVWRK